MNVNKKKSPRENEIYYSYTRIASEMRYKKKYTRARDDDDNNINANVHEENETEEKSSTDRGRRREHADSVSARRRIVTHGAR